MAPACHYGRDRAWRNELMRPVNKRLAGKYLHQTHQTETQCHLYDC
jgi:hypothetical protein